MGSAYNNFALLVGRIFLSVIFLSAGWHKLGDFSGTTGFMATRAAFESVGSMIPLLAGLAIFAELGGGLSLLLGWMTRLGAIGLVLFMIPTTLIFHDFWIRPDQTIMFFKNVAVIGALLILSTSGPGAISVDGRKKAS